jgi:Signal transduction histidine kinase
MKKHIRNLRGGSNKMKKLLVFWVAILFVASVGVASAQDKGTAAEAKALVKKGVAYMKEVGKDKALAEFANPKGMFIYKDLYIYATAMDGTNLAHPYTPAMTGKNYINLKDADGKLFVKETIELAKDKGGGDYVYRWTHPKTKKVEKKHVYVEAVPGMDLILTCGYYGE